MVTQAELTAHEPTQAYKQRRRTMKVYKIILAMLFSLLFMTTASADTGTIEGSLVRTSMTNGTVTIYTGDDKEVIKDVPLSVITDINHQQQNVPFATQYNYTFTVQNQGRYQDYTYTRQDIHSELYTVLVVALGFVLVLVLLIFFVIPPRWFMG